MVHDIEGETLAGSAGYPGDPETMVGSIQIDGISNPHGLRELASVRLGKDQDILRWAKSAGKDVVAIASSHGKEILIGVGVASIVTGATASAIILYKHRQRRKR